MDFISKFTAKYAKLSKKCLRDLEAIIEVKKYPKKTILTNVNEIPKRFLILKEGIVRSFLFDKKGKEFNRALFIKSELSSSFTALIQNKPSKFAFECFTDCEIVAGDYKEFIKLTKIYPELAQLYIKILEDTFVLLDNRFTEHVLLEAKDRYLNLIKSTPLIEEQLPQYHIASFLGITPVQLSRIRKKLVTRS